MPIDSNIYSNQRGAADLAGGFQDGLTLSQMIRGRKEQERKIDDQRKLKEAYQKNLVTGEDGSVSFDRGALVKDMVAIDPSLAMGQLDKFNQKDTLKQQALNAAEEKKYNRSIDDRDYKLKVAELRKKFEDKKAEGSEFQKTMDRESAKNLAEYQVGGGKNIVDTNIQRFEGAIKRLEEDGDLSGGVTGFLGETIQDAFNSDLSSVRDDIRSAIQGSLKPILGGQFTEKEAEAIFSRAFNPRLSDKENIRRANLELNNIKSIAANKDDALAFFQKNGTLSGFKASGLGDLQRIASGGGKNLRSIDPSIQVPKNSSGAMNLINNANAGPMQFGKEKMSRLEELRQKKKLMESGGAQ